VYQRKNGSVLPPFRSSTRAICCVEKLYSYSNSVAEDERQLIEQKLLLKIDDSAAKALQKLRKPNGIAAITNQDRYDFAVFLNSLRLRTPEAMAYGAKRGKAILDQRLKGDEAHLKFNEIGKMLNGLSLRDWFQKNQPQLMQNFGIEQMASLFFNPKLVHLIANMSWTVLNKSSQDSYFLTSDRPLIILGNLALGNLGLALSISPTQVFLASQNSETTRSFFDMSSNQFTREINISTIRQAECRAFALDKRHSLNFFEKRLGTHHNLLPWTE
jgi:hypothetical protein